ncbi:IclR family transcriptional regulator [Pseudomonas petrae]|uniref:IclR family transcriptional regulator n=1 Tax=Pseudomonas petrae TaxID=2912190 RepID=A0ABS9I6J1_9PSED|nr:IclR family transcriptional regulator [Pseudomonas petrae]MCF7532301.1 IclR family transcriptional regulator [Pseudomonas petrae]MCF7535933.1 IclR family transcriptional regulator [Pseudomonas petrae]MCF7542794.1 IclR family transcriptional regulator [Pseudomonas petrae]MCF7554997.1 IclR family transcriptional regulator [Pseudomonas petrae]
MNTESEKNPSDPGSSAEGGVAAVDRAFAILAAFDSEHDSLTLAEISRRTGLYKSTILRLITSLEKSGFLRRSSDGRYSVGPEPLRLSQLYQTSFRLRDVIHPLLESITEESGETSSFYVLENGSRVVLFRVEPKRAVRVSVLEGARFPLHAGASGKILRAFSGVLDPALTEVRERHWACSFGERDPETTAVSVPVFSMGFELKGALTLSGPSERLLKEHIEHAATILLRNAAIASNALGGNDRELQSALKRLSESMSQR